MEGHNMLLEQLYYELSSVGLVSNQQELSELCGKRRSWMSSSLCRGRELTLDALIRFYVQAGGLQRDISSALDGAGVERREELIAQAQKLSEVCATVWIEIARRIRPHGVAGRPVV
jgi:hypothetical protein